MIKLQPTTIGNVNFMPDAKKSCFFQEILAPLVKQTEQLTSASLPLYFGIVGPSASGKSTLAEFLKNYLGKKNPTLTISLIPLDNFIYPNQYLRENNLMERKGFPESFNAQALKNFIREIQKNNEVCYSMPLYSHVIKDIDPIQQLTICRSQIYIFEGISLFYSYPLNLSFCLANIMNWSIYLDINLEVIKDRSIKRFLAAYYHAKSSNTPPEFFKPLLNKSESEVYQFAENLWETVDVPTIEKYIRPQKQYASKVVKSLPTLEEFAAR